MMGSNQPATREVLFLGAEERMSQRTGNPYWVAIFLDGTETVQMFLDRDTQAEVSVLETMSKCFIKADLRPRNKAYQPYLISVVAG